MYIKKYFLIVIVIIFLFMTCHLISVENKNKIIKKDLESNIVMNLDLLNRTVKDLLWIGNKPDTSHAKELCAITSFAFDKYNIVSSKGALHQITRLVAAYRRNLYIIDENGINDVTKSNLEAIGKYLEFFQDSNGDNFKNKIIEFNEYVHNDEKFYELGR